MDFKKISGLSNQQPESDYVSGFHPFDGLQGRKNRIRRIAEVFGHEAGHAEFALANPTAAAFFQSRLNTSNAIAKMFITAITKTSASVAANLSESGGAAVPLDGVRRSICGRNHP